MPNARNRSKSSVVPLFTSLVLVAGACSFVACKPKIDDAELQRRCAAADQIASDRDAEWHAGIGDALAKDLGPRKDLGRCPLAMPTLQFETTFATVDATLARVGLSGIVRPSAIAVITPAEVASTSSLTARQVRYDTNNLRAHTDGVNERDGEYLLAEAKKASDPSRWKWDAIVILDVERAARHIDLDAGTFASGSTRGRVLVFDYGTKKVACAADFEAKNSARITVKADQPNELADNAKAKLENDLLVQTIKTAFNELWVAGPREARDAGR
jgi:hypothetical protein